MPSQSSAPVESYGRRARVLNSPDLQRMLALPRRALELDGTPRAEAIIDLCTEQYGRRNTTCNCAAKFPDRHVAEGCITRPRLVQALALREISIVGGLLGPIGVGHGKTLLDLLAPLAFDRHARSVGLSHGEQLLCVLLVPPKLLQQLADDYDYIGEHFHMPSMVMQGAPEHDRLRPGMPKLQVMPYSRIQRAEATSWMRVVKPHAIIADECHRLRKYGPVGSRRSATANRVGQYLKSFPRTSFAAWSGSITSRSIKDYTHLAEWALHAGSPVPTEQDTIDDVARAVDPGKDPADPGPLLDGLIASGCCKPGESLYRGMRRRLVETLGVVSASAPSATSTLELVERQLTTTVPESIKAHMANALAFIRPDGEELVTAMQAIECAIQIACGFHYYWIFPHNKFPEDTELVDTWRLRRKEWHKELRAMLKNTDEHMDSPLLLENAAERFYGFRTKHKGMPTWAAQTYLAWREIKSKVRPETVPARLDDFYVRDVCNWMREHTGIVWYWHRAFGEWVAEMSGAPLYGEGKDAARDLLKERGDRCIVVSAKAHAEGTNGLQFYFWDQYFTNPPSDPKGWEQTLGRTHRPKQPSDIVRCWFAMHTPELRKHIRSALHAALYIEGTWGAEQKLHVGFPDGLLEEILEDEE